MNFFTQYAKAARWKKKIDRSLCRFVGADVRASHRKNDGSLLFAYVESHVLSPQGQTLPGILFLRGDAVVIVPHIICKEEGRSFFLMVNQRRIADGEVHCEFPAGMLDDEVDNPRGVACRELEEETGMCIGATDLFLLHHKPLFTSPGGSDEAVWFLVSPKNFPVVSAVL
ncbi:NUDIX hydrolase [Chitinivibrio alkaliphilus]|uniref:GDP-mannose pyrophosphatase n=1 Tax=Chitinivibrio alkaliphilus ACht1 TaxID=1313304 RepID=U7D4K1_9BACT|nr:NUDIX domain-containing protein [Chitinivibrio alkaliphilus]ERP31439.1 hypothetical protein CALK_1640 [Chitinivibrio alkaliphilus ACht1]